MCLLEFYCIFIDFLFSCSFDVRDSLQYDQKQSKKVKPRSKTDPLDSFLYYLCILNIIISLYYNLDHHHQCFAEELHFF